MRPAWSAGIGLGPLALELLPLALLELELPTLLELELLELPTVLELELLELPELFVGTAVADAGVVVAGL